MRLENSHKTAIAIALLAVVWMVSGVFNDDAPQATADASAEAPADVVLTRVRVITVVSQDHIRTLSVLGRIEADKAVSVRAEVAGRVSEITVQKGALVNAGEVLVKIDSENRPKLLAEARARFEQRKIAYDSTKKLSKGGYGSQLNVAQAKADLEAAGAQVSGIERELNNATITAPLNGIVDELPLEAGDYIDKAGAIVARVIDLTTMLAIGEVAERDIHAIQLGGAAHVRLPDQRVVEGTVSYIAKSSNALTRTYSVEVTIPVPDRSVPEGLTAELHLPMHQIVAHNISPALLTLNDVGSVGVKTVNADNVVEFFPVEMVSDTEDGIWLTGLPHEARIITVGQEFVTPGQTVSVVEGDLKTMNDADAAPNDAPNGEGN